jgi:hypothetical protein
MKQLKNDKGSVLLFISLMIPLLLVMVGMGLDTGWLTYVRNLGQAAVDAGALSGASAVPTFNESQVYQRVRMFSNKYPGAASNPLGTNNTILVNYQNGAISAVESVTQANGVRVSLEEDNPYGIARPDSSIKVPVFLMPMLRLFGFNVPATAAVNVTATAILKGRPELPVALKGCFIGPRSLYMQPDSGKENACWTSYTVSPSSKPTLVDMVNDPCRIPAVDVNTPIDLDNGDKVPVRNAITNKYGPFDGKQCLIIPVVAQTASCSETKQSVPIEAFAKICITNIVETGGDKRIDVDIADCDVSLLGAPSRCSVPVLVRDQASGM